jgi:hypothetical protein
MQTVLTNIMDFVTGEIRAFLLIALMAGFLYAWVKLSASEQYYRWLLRFHPKNAETHSSLGDLLKKDPRRLEEAEQEPGRMSIFNGSGRIHGLRRSQGQTRNDKFLEVLLHPFKQVFFIMLNLKFLKRVYVFIFECLSMMVLFLV